MLITVNVNDPLPLYVQLVRQITMAVAAGELKPGDQLPSHRQLSRDLIINHLTVKKAYDELEAAGVVCTRRGDGTYVADDAPRRTAGPQHDALEQQAGSCISSARRLGLGKREFIEMVESFWDQQAPSRRKEKP